MGVRDDQDPQEAPPRGTEKWKAETKGIERVIDVLFTLQEPQTAGWIGEEALVSEQTTREHLKLFADLGVVTATTVSGVTKYQPDPTWTRFKEVSSLVEQYSRDELTDRVERYRTRIEYMRDRYDVETADGLRAKTAEEGTPIEYIQKYRKAASEWAEAEQELDVLKEALKRYEEYDRGRVPA